MVGGFLLGPQVRASGAGTPSMKAAARARPGSVARLARASVPVQRRDQRRMGAAAVAAFGATRWSRWRSAWCRSRQDAAARCGRWPQGAIIAGWTAQRRHAGPDRSRSRSAVLLCLRSAWIALERPQSGGLGAAGAAAALVRSSSPSQPGVMMMSRAGAVRAHGSPPTSSGSCAAAGAGDPFPPWCATRAAVIALLAALVRLPQILLNPTHHRPRSCWCRPAPSTPSSPCYPLILGPRARRTIAIRTSRP